MLHIAIYLINADPTKTTCPFGTFQPTTIKHAKRICEYQAKKLELTPAKNWKRISTGHYEQVLKHPKTQANYKLQISRTIH